MSFRRIKISLILASVAIVVGILGIRQQEGWLFTLGVLVSLFLLFRRAWSGSLSIGVLLIMVLPRASFNHLYGFDTHSPAILSREILRSGWPVQNLQLSWGYSGTPLLHIHAAITSIVSGLPLVPSVRSEPVVSAILPIVYVSVTLLFVYCLSRRNTTTPVAATVPLLFWIPFYLWKIPFSRQSIGILLFILGAWTIYRLFDSDDSRYVAIFAITAVAITVSHHLSAAFLWSLLFTATISAWLLNKKLLEGRFPVPLVFMTVVFLVWYVIAEIQQGRFVLILASILKNITSIGNTTSLPVWLAQHQIDYSLQFHIKKAYSLWIYQVLLAAPIILVSLLQLRNRTSSVEVFTTLLFGAIAGGLALIAMVAPVLDVARLMTYFVVFGGWTSISCLNQLVDNQYKKGVSILMSCLIILGGIMMPLYPVSTASPNYEKMGQKDEKFDEEIYVTSKWVGEYTTSPIYADSLVQEVMIPFLQRDVQTGYSDLVLKNTTNGRLVILSDRNNHIYFGHFGGRTVIINSDPVLDATLDNKKLYSNGDNEVYS